LWEPIDILDDEEWKDDENKWVGLLRKRSCDFFNNAAKDKKASKSIGDSFATAW
jgi:hypothetical protein